MTRNDDRLYTARAGLSPIQNDAVDAFVSGQIDRRQFVRGATVLGIGVPLMSALLSACGVGSQTGSGGGGQKVKGGTLRVAIPKPSGPIDPVTTANQGNILLTYPSGEFLLRARPNLTLAPVLAESWKSDKDASVWTFKLKPNVTFQDGHPMTSADVVATFDRLSDPAGGSTALSAFKGSLTKGGTTAIDTHTVRFELEAANGNFPYLVSSDNYSAVILPASYGGDYEKAGFPGTGKMKLKRYDSRGAAFVANAKYWDRSAMPSLDGIEYTYFSDEQPMLLALQGNQVDVVNQFSVQNGRAVLSNPSYHVISNRSAATRVLHLRNDMGPWKDKRVRQALALSLDRSAIVKGLLQGRAEIGNDSPFAPVFPSTGDSVPQRKQDLEKAKQLLAAAGVGRGFKAPLTVLNQQEIPDYAVLLQSAAKNVGIDLAITLQDAGTYYGSSKFGSSPWLDSTAGITDYGHRSVPNVPLTAQLKTGGVWNSAHMSNPQLDGLITSYVSAVSLSEQKTIANKLETLLLDETPLVYAYFYNILGVSTNKITGIVSNAQSQLFLNDAAFTK